MADFEDDVSANLAHATGVTENDHLYDSPELPQTHKPSDPSFDPFSTQPSSLSQKQTGDMSHDLSGGDVPPAHEDDYPPYDDHTDGVRSDLPANFARDFALRKQAVEGDNLEYCRDDEADFYEGGAADGHSPNPFSSSHEEDDFRPAAPEPPVRHPYQDSGPHDFNDDDRPIVGYNPFLEELQNKERAEDMPREVDMQGVYEDSSSEEEDAEEFIRERPLDPEDFGSDRIDGISRSHEATPEQDVFGQAPVSVKNHIGHVEDERVSHDYERLHEDPRDQIEADEDSADLEMDPLDDIQHIQKDANCAMSEHDNLVDPLESTEQEYSSDHIRQVEHEGNRLIDDTCDSRQFDDHGSVEGEDYDEREEDFHQEDARQIPREMTPEEEAEPESYQHNVEKYPHEMTPEADRLVDNVDDEPLVQKSEIETHQSMPGQIDSGMAVGSDYEDNALAANTPEEALHHGDLLSGDLLSGYSGPTSDGFAVHDEKDEGIVNQGFTDDIDMDDKAEEDRLRSHPVQGDIPEEDNLQRYHEQGHEYEEEYKEREVMSEERIQGEVMSEERLQGGVMSEERNIGSSELFEPACAPGAPPTHSHDDDVIQKQDDIQHEHEDYLQHQQLKEEESDQYHTQEKDNAKYVEKYDDREDDIIEDQYKHGEGDMMRDESSYDDREDDIIEDQYKHGEGDMMRDESSYDDREEDIIENQYKHGEDDMMRDESDEEDRVGYGHVDQVQVHREHTSQEEFENERFEREHGEKEYDEMVDSLNENDKSEIQRKREEEIEKEMDDELARDDDYMHREDDVVMKDEERLNESADKYDQMKDDMVSGKEYEREEEMEKDVMREEDDDEMHVRQTEEEKAYTHADTDTHANTDTRADTDKFQTHPSDFGGEKITSYAAAGFVDNLSGRESPETPVVPQPLPSPPEPKQDMSSFDPLSPEPGEEAAYTSGAPPTCQDLNLGQSSNESFFTQQPGPPLTEAACPTISTVAAPPVVNGTEILTAGEVEGETRFGVDGTAVTSTGLVDSNHGVAGTNNSFLHSGDYEEEEEDEEEEEEEESQAMDQGGVTNTYTGTTETSETSAEDRSGVDEEFGVQSSDIQETNDNVLMSMSMEGSFYDDGGDLIGGTDGHEGQARYQGGDASIITEEGSSYDGFTPKTDSFLADQDHFNQLQDDFREDMSSDSTGAHHEEDLMPSHAAVGQHTEPAVVNGGLDMGRECAFDSLVDTGKQDVFDSLSSAVNKAGDDSLMDAPVTDPGLQTPVPDQSHAVDTSSVDKSGLDSLVSEFDSNVDPSPPLASVSDVPAAPQMDSNVTKAHEVSENVDVSTPKHQPIPQITETLVGKPEESLSSSVDNVIESKEVSQTAAAPAAPEVVAAIPEAAAAEISAPKEAAAAASPATPAASAAKKTTTKSTTKAATPASKTTKDAKTPNGRQNSAKKPDSIATNSAKKPDSIATKSTTKKPAETSRPSSAKTTGKTATSPTKPASTTPSTPKPLPSYAQPITPRKPREPAPAAKKPATPRSTSTGPTRPASATTTSSRPASSTTRTPRPASAATSTTAGSPTKPTSTSSTAKATTKTTPTTTPRPTRPTTTSTPRPKSSPTKLSNGTHTDSSSPTKPRSQLARPTSEKKDVKTAPKTEAGTRGTPASTPGVKSPTKPSTPRTPGSATKTTEVKSKIGSLNNATEVKSKIGSLNNATHAPGGGSVKISHKKPDYSNVTSRVGSKAKIDHKPGGGQVKIENRKTKVEAKSKIGSLENASHKPTGGDKKIESQKLDFKEKAAPKIGSLDKSRLSSESSDTAAPATEPILANGTGDHVEEHPVGEHVGHVPTEL